MPISSSSILSITVRVGGRQIPDFYELVRIEVIAEASRVPSATLTLRDGSAAGEDFPSMPTCDEV